MSDFSFDSVFVIESLRDQDRKTGSALYTNVLRPNASGHDGKPPVELFIYSPKSKKEFCEDLSEIAQICKTDTRKPILHIETHGWDKGLSVGNGGAHNELAWQEVLPFIRAINRASRVNTFVFVAACEGANFLATVLPDESDQDVVSAYAMVGPLNEIYDDDLATECAKFYSELLDSYSIEDALATLSQDRKYAYVTASWWFSYVVYNFLDALNGDVLKAWCDKILEKLKLEGLPQEHECQVAQLVAGDLENPDEILREMHARYFMTNDVPENSKRFPFDASTLMCGSAPEPPLLGSVSQI